MDRSTAKDATTPDVGTVAVRGAVLAGIVQELRSHRGQLVTLDQLHQRLYGNRKDGGADLVSIQKAIHVLRKAGLPIVRTSGYSLF
jgi:hypothetical protein